MLFPSGEDPLPGSEQPTLPRLASKRAQSWTLNELANSYSLSGQPRRAVSLYEAAITLDEGEDSKVNLAVNLGNVASLALFPIGRLAPVEANLRRRIELCSGAGNAFEEAVGRAELVRLLAYQGAFEEAAAELGMASR